MKKLINISVSFLSNVKNQRANCGEKFMGNESLVKKHGDKAYLSAQSIRHALIDTMESLNRGFNDTYFSTSDSDINTSDLKAELQENVALDFRGIMLPSENVKRYSTIKTNHSFAMEASNLFFDLLLQFKNKTQDHNIVKNEISHRDMFLFNLSLDVERVLALDEIAEKQIEKDRIIITKALVPVIANKKKFVEEKQRRIELFLRAIENLHGFANQSRNLIDATPKEIFIVFNHITHDNKYLNFFEKSIEERLALLDYCKANKIDYLLYDSTLASQTDKDLGLAKNVYEVFSQMIGKLNDFDLSLS